MGSRGRGVVGSWGKVEEPLTVIIEGVESPKDGIEGSLGGRRGGPAQVVSLCVRRHGDPTRQWLPRVAVKSPHL